LHNGHKLLAVVLNQTRSGADVMVDSRALDYLARGYFSILKSDLNLHLSLNPLNRRLGDANGGPGSHIGDGSRRREGRACPK
jgi:hypothetical protein